MSNQDPRELKKIERVISPYHHIDPGFINPRLCFSTFGEKFHALYERYRKTGNDHWSNLTNDHILVDMVLRTAGSWKVPPLTEVLQNPVPGKGFCSTEKSKGSMLVYGNTARVRSEIILPFKYDKKVFLSFGTEHFVADTGKLEMSEEHVVSIIGIVRSVNKKEIVLYPLIIGAPSFDHPENKNIGVDPSDLMWGGWDLYQLVPEDIDEFHNLSSVTIPAPEEWKPVMKSLSEAKVKEMLAEILGDNTKKDWGGENNDHFASSIHIKGKRKSAAFLLKGPSKFSEMKMTHLGRNADQLVRLSHTPAQVLIVQHSHNIGEAVRETLRAIAVQPSNPRHYCILDGRDTYRILKSYGKI